MLSAWNAENINQVVSGSRTGKIRKTLGDTGLGSENAPPRSGKGAVLSESKGSKHRLPLGYRSENAPHATGKEGGRLTDSKPKQRKALGDISNAGKLSLGGASSNSGSKFGGKQLPSGLKFSVHSDSRSIGKDGSGASAGKASSTPSTSKAKAVLRESERTVSKPEAHVDDVEAVMGRTWEEEDALVQKRAEQRAAKAVNPFRSATKRTPRARKASFPARRSSSNIRVVEAAATPRDKKPAPVNAVAESDQRLDSAIDRMVLRDLEVAASARENLPSFLERLPERPMASALIDELMMLAAEVERSDMEEVVDAKGILVGEGKSRDGSMKDDHNLDWLGKLDDILDSPLPSSVVDDGLLTQDLDLSFA